MTFNEYQKLAERTASDAMLPEKVGVLLALVAGTLGLCGESGEAADIVKKCQFHDHPLDEEAVRKLKKELGDILWYVAWTATVLGVDLEDLARSNIQKLKDRYPDGFTSEKSINRVEDREYGSVSDTVVGEGYVPNYLREDVNYVSVPLVRKKDIDLDRLLENVQDMPG